MITSRDTHSAAGREAREYLAGWQRARAELDNFRKNLASQKEADRRYQRQMIIEPLLSLADNFRSIAQHVPASLEHDNWVAGVLHVARQFDEVLSSYGVTRIEAVGVQFDPGLHEAVEQVKGNHQTSGTVLEVVQPGYKLSDTLIRPAKVKVSK